MPDHIHGDHDHSPYCTICLTTQHADYDKQQAKEAAEAAKDAALLATSNGPVLFWGCLLALVIVGLGLLVPVALWRLT
ncbi:hypothetical protein RCO28_20615 [Streptomyces sp. LHD-70]|uniref:hypothetical protein n=1 Tax=Streptomyces sp. LHD-70 TaxID=3072140 RepID=UPI00280F529F|nr:hypothetical protein [Streptomyces sp. LHD-70]MDQ8704876.1 hypothetical protein [Streptomyces sp. LHD-70]